MFQRRGALRSVGRPRGGRVFRQDVDCRACRAGTGSHGQFLQYLMGLARRCPLWSAGHFIKWCDYYKLRIQFDSFKGKWGVRVGKHHYSRSPSLRAALIAALRKLGRERDDPNWLKKIYGKMPELGRDRPAKTQPPKI